MGNRSKERDRLCARCGVGPIRGYKFCSTSCRELARRQEFGVQTREERAASAVPPERSCIVCNKVFRRRVKAGDAAICCSRDCGFALIRERGRISRSIHAEKAIYARWSRCNARKASATVGNRCLTCHIRVGKHRQRCETCREAQHNQTQLAYRASQTFAAVKRAAKARRRALERSPHAERFDPFEIFERDGWRCHLCRCSTPKRLRGSCDPRAPELDHIIPLALDGRHTRANTACCCRKCNGEKGAKPLGQLRLLG